jgi:peptide/nickel transport system permease protein
MSIVDRERVAIDQAHVVVRPSEILAGLTWRNLRRVPILPLTVIFLFAVVALFGTWLAPNDPYATSLGARLLPPAWMEGGDPRYLLGTDRLGRDVFSRIIVGALPSFKVALAALLFGSMLGSFIGMVSGYLGGRVDAIIMRFADGTMAFPLILAALLLAAVIGPGGYTVVIAACIVLWARFARLIRSEVLSVKQRDFVKLARVAGASSWRIMIAHILPNVLNSVMVLLTLQLGFVIILEATLSFLGAGIPPPTPTWGQMVADGRDYLEIAWWLTIFPGLAIAVVVLSFNLLGDWLRDHTDPRLRQI